MNSSTNTIDPLSLIEHIILVEDVERYKHTHDILERSGVERITRMSEEEYAVFLQCLPFAASKKVLALKVFPGSFARACPGTRSPYLCCRYEVISPTVNCPIGCSYCILQCYLNEPVNIVYVNFEQAVEDAVQRYSRTPERLIRVGTGELGDSLVFEPWTRMGEYFVDAFAGVKNVIFELKSKAVCIDRLLSMPAPENSVLSWSLNPERITQKEEPYAASISDRLAAAKVAVEHGYMVGFHFDPIIYHTDGEKLYGELAELLAAAIPQERIAWISLGCMRFPSELLPVVREHQENSVIFSEEMIRGTDGKWRYPRPLRIKMYRWVWHVLNRELPEVFTYMCMEKGDVWKEVLGWVPQNNTEFDRYFTESLKSRFAYFSSHEGNTVQ